MNFNIEKKLILHFLISAYTFSIPVKASIDPQSITSYQAESHLADYLRNLYPSTTVLSNDIQDKINAVIHLIDASNSTLISNATLSNGNDVENNPTAGQKILLTSTDVLQNLSPQTLLNGIQSLSGITSFTVTSAASNNSNTVIFIGNDGTPGQTYSFTFTSSIPSGGNITFTNGIKTITLVNNSGNAITSAATLAAYLDSLYPVNSVMIDTTSHNYNAIITLIHATNCTITSSATLNNVNDSTVTATLDQEILINPTGTLSTDLETLADLLVTTPGATLESDVQTLNELLDGTVSGSTTQSRIDNLSDKLVGNHNYAHCLSTQITSMQANLDNGFSSLPSSLDSVTISSITTDNSGGINITLSNAGNASGTYNLSNTTLSIANNTTFNFIKDGYTLSLINRSNSVINNQTLALIYLNSMYPTGSKISTTLSDTISSLEIMIGGSASSLRAKIASVDRTLLSAPTGVVSTDLATARGLLTETPGASMESDIQTINAFLNGQLTGLSTTAALVGVPQSNEAPSNFFSIIGGTGASVADLLGDPITGTGGISNLIKASNASNSHSININAFTTATSLYDQLNAFLGLFQPGVTITLNASPSSLADIVNAMGYPI